MRSRDLYFLSKMADCDRHPDVTENPKKRQKLGRKWEQERDKRLSSHVCGPPCKCKRLQCFEKTSAEERGSLLTHFNSLKTKDHQDSFLSTMVRVQPVKRRRPRKDEAEASLHDFSYAYSIKVVRGEEAVEIPVCLPALTSIFGITKSRLERIRSSLARKGLPPTNMQGKHDNRPLAFKPETVEAIIKHIKSFRGRKSHYSLHDTRKLYLSEELSLCKMHRMFEESFPEHKVSRESYRKIFTEKFNISFGYPRKDTCSECDRLRVIRDSADTTEDDLRQANVDYELHLRKAQVFYDRKSAARRDAQMDETHAAVAFDFAKNLPSPNIATNDVYYKRQLSLYTFNVHNLADDSVHLYCYDETQGKKGADDVASMLRHFFTTILPPDVKHLELFCDSCAGQNKNYTILRFLHSMVHTEKRFTYVRLTFPIRGHSYMECDRDMAVVNQKVRAETPEDWMNEFSTCRKKPSPFNVVKMDITMFKTVSDSLKGMYKAACPIPTRPLREVIFSQEHPSLIQYREAWHGPYSTAVLSKPVGKRGLIKQQPLASLYAAPIPISAAKFADLQVLKKFCSPEAQEFFGTLPHAGNIPDGEASASDSSFSESE